MLLAPDIDAGRIAELRGGRDHTLEMEADELAEATHLQYGSDPSLLDACNVYIVTVPTPIDAYEQPDLEPLRSATRLIASHLRAGDLVIYESTVYPGTTEEVCVPLLEQGSGLGFNEDFYCGYSPERVSPGDRQRRLADIRKITSGSTPEVAAVIDGLYQRIIDAGTFPAPSMRVAEAAKVVENIQRDVNIALVNELAAFAPLKDPDQFATAQVTDWGWTLEWECGASLDSDRVLEMAMEQAGLRANIEIIQAQRFRQPARAIEEAFRFPRHVALLQVSNQLNGLRPCPFAHRLQDAALGDTAEVIGDGRLPACLDQIEPGGACQAVRFVESTVEAVLADPHAAVGVRPLQLLHHVRAVDAVRVVAAPIDVWTV